MNVSSIVARTKPDNLEKVIASINALESCEVHFYDAKGSVVVTIEGENIDKQLEKLRRIQDLPDVMSTNLMYSYCEDEVNRALSQINDKNLPIPDM